MSFKAKIAAGAATFALAGGGVGLAGTTVASASTPTCDMCTHVQNVYVGGNLDAIGQGANANSPVILWHGTRTTSDPAQDFRWFREGTVSPKGRYAACDHRYDGDRVIRLQYTPRSNNSANVCLGLNGLKAAIRPYNQVDPAYQSWIVVDLKGPTVMGHPEAVLINVGETTNPADPYVLTDPHHAAVRSKVQLDLEVLHSTQDHHADTAQLWRIGDSM